MSDGESSLAREWPIKAGFTVATGKTIDPHRVGASTGVPIPHRIVKSTLIIWAQVTFFTTEEYIDASG